MVASTITRSIVAFCTLSGLAMILLPYFLDEWALLQLMIYVIMSIFALSLGFIWGIGGILSFGQGVFLGLGSYSYAIAALNLGNTTIALGVGIIAPGIFAAILGYFLFFGRISDVYLGAITLTVTLIFFDLLNSTSGPQYRIGTVALGGFNGIPAVPRLTVPGTTNSGLSTTQLFCFCVVVLALTYSCLKIVSASEFGRLIVAVRENEVRAQLLGYDSRKLKLATFVIGGCVAGLAGALFAIWGAYTSPTVFALGQSVQAIIWVVVGGLGTFLGPVVGCILIQWLTAYAGSQDWVDTSLLLGAVLTIFVLLLPAGLVPTIQRIARGARQKLGSRDRIDQNPRRPREVVSGLSGADQ